MITSIDQRPGFEPFAGCSTQLAGRFVWVVERTPAVPEFTVADDLSDLVNADTVAYWSDEAKAQLRENGFIVVDSSYDEFYTLYESNRYSYTPSFVTVDAMLHTYHLYFLYLQRQTEQQHLLPLLEELTAAMLAESQAQAQLAPEPVIRGTA